ncbi:hypothetical protein A3J43_00525 [Candidatus Uhrbacteria bacterium RIFCSPHIGHO2_12_FULL_54_23]|uniref:Uncharacterized protein n=3 Tax=Candidatus Uhriibacteriota TaxID=1752732 RepID=A0A1F7UG84_9BACT|nr:MAG: hypothetical protein A3J43_00525 [Candidatus Uhrbacteria bacterium RIFCSPHIGHO2_12_FULL_54_23]OGL85253.1 MAG: hypothetical protein A3B36_00115 [Candidatus Uhrbacteria bacterium RIFCSPLOWO2_01_FULL_55_36]OGL89679.1 MAG: hypothetical protein A3J36_01260 [Candidatus Uhrbacteria bacterium RIFCSPLOWO2_02_FULL_54_37]
MTYIRRMWYTLVIIMMTHAKIFIIIILLLATGASVWQWRAQRKEPPQSVPPQGIETPQDQWAGEVVGTVVVQHRFLNGTHIYSGTLTTPTPCHQVSADARVMESYPEQIVLALTLQEPEPDAVCVQMIAELPFTVQVRASEEASVRGELDGAPVRLELIEGGDGIHAPSLGIELMP